MPEAAHRPALQSPFLGLGIAATVAGWLFVLDNPVVTPLFKVGALLAHLTLAVLIVALPFIVWRFFTARGRRQPRMTALNLFLIGTAAALAGVVATKYMVADGVRKLEAAKALSSSTETVPPSTSIAHERKLQPWERDWGSAADAEEAKVSSVYPEWQETVNSQAFKRWFEEQTADMRALAESPRAVDAIALIWHFERRAGGKSKASPAP